MSWLNRDAEQKSVTPDYPEDYPEDDEDVANYLSELLQVNESIEKHLLELVNQGDRQVEFLSRLVTLFESAAREARQGGI